MSCALGVFAVLEEEVEPQLGQVGDMPDFWVGGGGFCGQDGVNDAQGGGLFLLDVGVFDPVSF